MSVAVIGAGAMGRPMALRLHQAGIDVLVCDRDEKALASLASQGLHVTTQAADCAKCSVILVLVATGEQARDVAESLISRGDAERPELMVLMSTIGEDAVFELHERLAPAGVRVVDAPISGGAVRAQEGSLSVMAGGDEDDLELLRPILEPLTTRVFHCGPLGSGARMKIINNIVGTTSALVLAEACRLATEQGLNLDAVASVLDASSGRVFLTSQPGELQEFYGHVARDPQTFYALAAIMRKDFGLAVDLAAAGRATLPLLGRLKEFADTIGDETYENWHAVGQTPRSDSTERTTQ